MYVDDVMIALGFCTCGDPEGCLEYIKKGLDIIDEDRGDETWEQWWPKHKARRIAHHGNEAAAQFFHYWADAMEITEHGGCIPGWLTNKGAYIQRTIGRVLDNEPEAEV